VLNSRWLRNRGAQALRGVARRLAAPRDEAFLAAAQAGFVLVTGQRLKAGLSAYREPRIDGRTYRRAEQALQNGDVARAQALADELYAEQPRSVRVLRLRRQIASRMGDLPVQAAMLHEIHRL